MQIARAWVKQWTPRVEQRFLATLAATCNVKVACAEVGMWPPSAYNHRKRWHTFAAKWDSAIEEGYARIECALVEKGCNIFSNPEPPDAAETPEMSFSEAVHLLYMHQNRVHGMGKAPGLEARRMKDQEVLASILRKIRAMERGLSLGEADRARSEREWARRRGPE